MQRARFISRKSPVKARARRRQFGQAIVEGVVMISLMVLFLVCFVMLMLFIGSSMYYTNQITHIAQQAAIYGMNQAYYAGLKRPTALSTIQSNTQAAMEPLLKAIGLPDASVDFTLVSHNGISYGQATVTAKSVPMMGGGNNVFGLALPSALTLSQTALSLETDSVPPYIACIAAYGGSNAQSGCVQVPCIAAAQPFNYGSSPSYFSGSIGVPGAAVTSAPGYCSLLLDTTTSAAGCRVFRQPYSAGPGWAY